MRPVTYRLSLEAVARAYLREHPNCKPDDELRSFAREASLESAVGRACRAERPDGRRYHHQRRLPSAVLLAMESSLPAAALAGAGSFHELHERVRERIGGIQGVGNLTVYDTALRIGAKLQMLPDRVYLHAGTRLGARNLGLRWREPFLLLSELPAPLRVLKPWQIEDLLCVYKDQLERVAAQRRDAPDKVRVGVRVRGPCR